MGRLAQLQEHLVRRCGVAESANQTKSKRKWHDGDEHDGDEHDIEACQGGDRARAQGPTRGREATPNTGHGTRKGGRAPRCTALRCTSPVGVTGRDAGIPEPFWRTMPSQNCPRSCLWFCMRARKCAPGPFFSLFSALSLGRFNFFPRCARPTHFSGHFSVTTFEMTTHLPVTSSNHFRNDDPSAGHY